MNWRKLFKGQRKIAWFVGLLIVALMLTVTFRPKSDTLVGYVYGVEAGASVLSARRALPDFLSVKLDTGTLVTVTVPTGTAYRPGARIKLGIYTVKGGGPQDRILKFEGYADAAP